MGFGEAMAHGMPYAQQRMSPVRIHIFINLVHDANGKPYAQLPGMLLSVCCYRFASCLLACKGFSATLEFVNSEVVNSTFYYEANLSTIIKMVGSDGEVEREEDPEQTQ